MQLSKPPILPSNLARQIRYTLESAGQIRHVDPAAKPVGPSIPVQPSKPPILPRRIRAADSLRIGASMASRKLS